MQREPGYERIAQIIADEPSCRISAGSLIELWIVVRRSGNPGLHEAVVRYLDQIQLMVEPVTATQVAIAQQGFDRYGRGMGHPARLNFGDCFAYALAIERGEPLLFVGEDFRQTDVVPALS
jgi:ribonuclease VapC